MLAINQTHKKAISTQRQAQFQTTKMLRVLRFLFPQQKWDTNRLHQEARQNGPYRFEQGMISHVGQPGGRGTEHLWEIVVSLEWVQALIEARQKADWEEKNSAHKEVLWNGIFLRSPAEIAVAEALQRKGVLFFANAKCRLKTRSGQAETWETDFLVFFGGKTRILEVDGRAYHQNPAVDYKRDRMLAREGIQSSRFTALECLENADEVVAEFLELVNGACFTQQASRTTDYPVQIAEIVSVDSDF